MQHDFIYSMNKEEQSSKHELSNIITEENIKSKASTE